MKRAHSPLSDNTIGRLINEEEENYCSEEPSLAGSDNEIVSSSSVDDTDNDPTFDPDQPGPSTRQFRLNLSRPRIVSHEESDSDSSDSVQSRPNVRQPRGRPPGPMPTNDESESTDESSGENEQGWVDVNEENDRGYLHPFSFLELPGVRHCPRINSPVIEYFRLFFTVSLLEMFSKYTNMYAERVITAYNSSKGPNDSIRTWQRVTPAEIQAFICVLINMGLNHKPTIASYWWTSSSQSTEWFRRMFSRNRFQDILAYLHMVDTRNLPKPKEPDYDPCARVKPLIDHMNQISKRHYTPNKFLSIDESIIPTKCHNPLMQYMPKKHHRFGVKLWLLCDAVTHYCVYFLVYKGAKNTERQQVKETSLGHNVVTKLLDVGGCLWKGFHLFVDNFFTSIRLAKSLYEKFTHITGTIRMNRKGIPLEMKENYTIGQRKYKRKNTMLLLGYRQRKTQKKPVLLLSTDAKAGEQQQSKKGGNKIYITIKPKVIGDYNKYMGGVDSHDQMLHQYMGDRKSAKFWKKITLNVLSRMILNSYILYKENTINSMSRLKFTVTLVHSLSEEWFDVKEQRPAIAADFNNIVQEEQGGGDADQLSMYFEKVPDKKQKNCCVCSAASTSRGGKRKKSSYTCRKCKKGLHTKCFPLHKC
ncbi:zinc finger protein [Homalodisca vitripennis]|nr:zinc finger protein [Homalodisca vitripennis]